MTKTRIRCPWHNEKTGSCLINWDTQQVICFGCGHEATIFELSDRLQEVGDIDQCQMVTVGARDQIVRLEVETQLLNKQITNLIAAIDRGAQP